MKLLAKTILPLVVLAMCSCTALAKDDRMQLSIDGLTISELVKLVSATTKKNIFMSEEVAGTINYSGNKPIGRKDLYRLLQTTLETKGYTLVDTGGGFLNVVKITDAVSMNLPFMQKSDIPQMQTQIFTFKYTTAENMGNKIKHFVTKNGKLTFSKDSNSVIVTDFPDTLETIKKAMKVMDVKDESAANSTYVIGLKNADSKQMVATLNTIISKMTLVPGQQPPSIASDDATNSIVIIASEVLYKSLESTIKSLDSYRQQVYVRAKIIEISDKKSQEVGIKYGLSGGAINSAGIFAFDSLLGGSLAPVETFTKAAVAAGATLPAFTSAIALGVNIALLNTNGAANILSEPSLLCIDNQESSIYVGKTESISTGTTTSVGVAQQSFSRQDIGLTLKVKPRLSNDNKVLLGVTTKLEDVESGSNSGQPITTKREVLTSAIVSNGESVIIGGLIREKQTEVNTKIPFLGDIPYAGALFRSTATASDRINLVIILTPYIVGKSDDLTSLRAQLSELDKIEKQYVNEVTKKLEAKVSAQ
jgi:general secretion pathway protein D